MMLKLKSTHFLLAASLVALATIAAFKNSIIADDFNQPRHVDYCWRILIGLGCVPGAIALYFRLTIPETPRFTMDIDRGVQRARADIPNVPRARADFPNVPMRRANIWNVPMARANIQNVPRARADIQNVLGDRDANVAVYWVDPDAVVQRADAPRRSRSDFLNYFSKSSMLDRGHERAHASRYFWARSFESNTFDSLFLF